MDMTQNISTNNTSELPLEVLGMFRVIFKSASQHFESIEKSVGVSGAQLWAMSEIMAAGTLTISQLGKAMSLHQSTTSNLVEKLESKGLVVRVRSTQDRRVVEVQLTEVGRNALANAPGPYRGILPDALMRTSEQDLLELKACLGKLLGCLEKRLDNASGEPLGVPITSKIR